MIASILSAQGYKVGFYSSPHMIDFKERIRVNDVQITSEEVVGLVESMRERIEKVKGISTFEITTALAFQYFFEKQVDIAVIEVGMGGRLDATNVVHPILTAITSISLDHTMILGDTIAKIAKEKAGIIKERVPVVIAKQSKEAKEVISDIARKANSQIIDIENDLDWEQVTYSLENQSFRIVEKKLEESSQSPIYTMPLLGDHQLDNALTAYAVVKSLPAKYHATEAAISAGFKKAQWTGRFEVISNSPMIIIDGAHNPYSFDKLSQTIQKYLPGEKVTLIFGASEDKDVPQMIEIISPFVEKIIYTRSDHPRAMTREDFLAILTPQQLQNFCFEELETLINEIKSNTNEIYLAAGSIFIAGAVKQMLQN
jgi:dihydrofolate synthase/folylpolyglutamate synthase